MLPLRNRESIWRTNMAHYILKPNHFQLSRFGSIAPLPISIRRTSVSSILLCRICTMSYVSLIYSSTSSVYFHSISKILGENAQLGKFFDRHKMGHSSSWAPAQWRLRPRDGNNMKDIVDRPWEKKAVLFYWLNCKQHAEQVAEVEAHKEREASRRTYVPINVEGSPSCKQTDFEKQFR